MSVMMFKLATPPKSKDQRCTKKGKRTAPSNPQYSNASGNLYSMTTHSNQNGTAINIRVGDQRCRGVVDHIAVTRRCRE